jgi:hypothetical protein
MTERISSLSKRRQGLLGVSAVLAVAAHLAVLAAFVWRPALSGVDPGDTGAVELLMVEQEGAEASVASPPPQQQQRPVEEKAERTEEAVPRSPAAQAEQGRPVPPVASKPLVMSLSGTDSDANAQVIGDRVLPASVDNKYRNRPPRFPDAAAMRGAYGAVVVIVHVNPQGLVDGVEVAESSGHAELDRAAVAAVQKWRFHPAMRDGMTVPFDMPFRFDFVQ